MCAGILLAPRRPPHEGLLQERSWAMLIAPPLLLSLRNNERIPNFTVRDALVAFCDPRPSEPGAQSRCSSSACALAPTCPWLNAKKSGTTSCLTC
ncbi:hypothetical protein B0H12DRAFT_1133782 [Mycena haematopus]|nr:hypothetical protein B0H12DRAFT_1133782 [Mycena haematopus]